MLFLVLTRNLVHRRRRLAALFKEEGTSTTRKTELLGQRHTLRHHINSWREIQSIYMPGVAQLRDSLDATPAHPEDEVLYLPSSITSDIRTCCIPGLPNIECRVRTGQADDALNEVRRQLRITSSIIQFKRGQHQASQQLSRKSRALMAKFTKKTHRAAERYNAAYNALLALDPEGEGDWTSRLQPLNISKDLHLPRREDDDGLDEEKEQGKGSRFRGRKQGENQRELSWIWRAQHAGGRPSRVTSVDEVNESKSHFSSCFHRDIYTLLWLAMQVEWAKTKARADRWDEEFLLTIEEMRRTIEFFDWKARWWIDRASLRTGVSVALQSGLHGYAHKQAAVYRGLAHSFARKWYPLLVANSIPVEWPATYIPASTPSV